MYLTIAGNTLYFAATDPFYGRELFMIRANPDSPVYDTPSANRDMAPRPALVTDIVPGAASSNPSGITSSGGNLPIYFAAYSPTNGIELWVSNGYTVPINTTGSGASSNTDPVVANTVMIADICSGTRNSNPKYLTWYEGKLYFQADDCLHGKELFVATPTIVGSNIAATSNSNTIRANGVFINIVVTLLKDIRLGLLSSSPAYFTIMPSHTSKSYLYFTATNGYMMRDGVGGDSSGNTEDPTEQQGIPENEPYGGSQIWRTDGTFEGTMRAFQHTENDIYIDKEGLDELYPSTMTVFNNLLLLSGRVGTASSNNANMSTINSEQVQFGLDQAAVITDVDTADDENITVILSSVSATNGGILVLGNELNPSISINATTERVQTLSEQQQLRFLLVEDLDRDRDFMLNAFYSMGYGFVDYALEGHLAYAKYLDGFQTLVKLPLQGTIPVPPQAFPYNVLIISLNFAVVNSSGVYNGTQAWDGLDTIRMIRQYESQNGVQRIVIIAVAKLDTTINNNPYTEALAAGADTFMFLKETHNFDAESIVGDSFQVPIFEPGVVTTIGMDLYSIELEQASYNNFVSAISQYLFTAIMQPTDGLSMYNGVSIQYSIVSDTAITLSQQELAYLPGKIIGNQFYLTGTLTQINLVLRDVYYYARSGAGNDAINITVIDTPQTCTPAELQHTAFGTGSYANATSSYVPHRPQSVVRVFTNAFSKQSLTAEEASILTKNGSYPVTDCDITNSTNIVSTVIPIYITPLNQAPQIILTNISIIQAVADFAILVPPITVVDSDHINLVSSYTSADATVDNSASLSQSTGILSSFGDRELPPVTVMISVNYGSISIMTEPHGPLSDNDQTVYPPGDSISTSREFAYIQGRGFQDKKLIIRGAIDNINSVLSSLQYICQTNAAGTCVPGAVDTIFISVDDEGFYGKGGPLTASASMAINLVAA